MTIRLVTDEKIAETSSKGNQEKWYDRESDRWHKLDQFGYEALTETVISVLLERSNIEAEPHSRSSAIIWNVCWSMAGSVPAVQARTFCGLVKHLLPSIACYPATWGCLCETS